MRWVYQGHRPDSLLPLFLLAISEYNFVYNEENNHGHAAIKDSGSDIIEPRCHEVTCDGSPDAIDGIDNTSNHAKGQKIPQALAHHIALGAKHPAALDEEIDDLTHKHGNHIGSEISNSPLVCPVTNDIPLKFDAKQGKVNAGESEVPAAQERKSSGQEGKQKILKHGDGIADDHKQAALPYPLGKRGMPCSEVIPPFSHL